MIDDACSWDRPGHNPYIGEPRPAIMALAQIPEPIRLKLIEKAERNQYDDLVDITRDRIVGQKVYRDEISFMAFGSKGTVCKTVTRHRWHAEDVQRAMVFCADGWCVARPSVCNNWSIITPVNQVRLSVVPPPASAPTVVHTVPEPSTLMLVALAIGVLIWRMK